MEGMIIKDSEGNIYNIPFGEISIFSPITKEAVTTQTDVLLSLFKENKMSNVDITYLCRAPIDAIAKYYNIPASEFLKKGGQRHVFHRVILVQILMVHYKIREVNIGKIIGGIGHSTVSYYRKLFNDFMDTDKVFKQDYINIYNSLI